MTNAASNTNNNNVSTNNNNEVKPIVTLTPDQLKANIEKVIQESFKKCKNNQFKDLEYYFLDKKSQSKTLKQKLEIFHSLDIYSKTFLSIHIKTKATLREFNTNKFEGEYLELLRLILTLSDKLNNRNLKSIKTKSKEPVDLNTLKSSDEKTNKAIEILKKIKTLEVSPILRQAQNDVSTKQNSVNKYNIKDNTQIIKEYVTGKNLNKRTKKSKALIKQLNDLNL